VFNFLPVSATGNTVFHQHFDAANNLSVMTKGLTFFNSNGAAMFAARCLLIQLERVEPETCFFQDGSHIQNNRTFITMDWGQYLAFAMFPAP
jgi:hypothetical protein